MDPLTFPYNFQPHTSTSVAPFEPMSSKPQGPLAIKPMPTSAQTKGDFKCNWKHWLNEAMVKTEQRLDAAQEHYKKNSSAVSNGRMKNTIVINNACSGGSIKSDQS